MLHPHAVWTRGCCQAVFPMAIAPWMQNFSNVNETCIISWHISLPVWVGQRTNSSRSVILLVDTVGILVTGHYKNSENCWSCSHCYGSCAWTLEPWSYNSSSAWKLELWSYHWELWMETGTVALGVLHGNWNRRHHRICMYSGVFWSWLPCFKVNLWCQCGEGRVYSALGRDLQ